MGAADDADTEATQYGSDNRPLSPQNLSRCQPGMPLPTIPSPSGWREHGPLEVPEGCASGGSLFFALLGDWLYRLLQVAVVPFPPSPLSPACCIKNKEYQDWV